MESSKEGRKARLQAAGMRSPAFPSIELQSKRTEDRQKRRHMILVVSDVCSDERARMKSGLSLLLYVRNLRLERRNVLHEVPLDRGVEEPDQSSSGEIPPGLYVDD